LNFPTMIRSITLAMKREKEQAFDTGGHKWKNLLDCITIWDKDISLLIITQMNGLRGI
jgi:hypothetical protein